jgi:predicted TIM-barrel fold metal-dependent hydrolase
MFACRTTFSSARVFFVIFFLAGCGPRPDSAEVDSAIAAEIEKIKAIDNHGHPLHVTSPGEQADDTYDALTFEEMEPFPSPLRIRFDNPEYLQAWKTLYGYKHDDMSEAHVKELVASKQAAMKERGDGYPAWVLDQLGIETMLANRAAMGRGLAAPRFRWVSMIDALIFPLSNEAARRKNPDYRSFYVGEGRLLKRYLSESGVDALPASLDDYVTKVLTPTLERHKREGAVAVKFEAAYLRSLDFATADEGQARRTYARYVRGGEPPATEYKNLQDHLFHRIARESGRLGLAVHIHACYGAGGYYSMAGSHPVMLESAFNDPALRKTNFVIVHGGWPFSHEVGPLLLKPNVYTDTSAMSFVLYPRAMAAVLRDWLELMPEKVLFGTDVEPFAPHVNWEETGWQTTMTVRRALGIALTGMMRDGETTRDRAIKMARLVMRGNAAKLYALR